MRLVDADEAMAGRLESDPVRIALSVMPTAVNSDLGKSRWSKEVWHLGMASAVCENCHQTAYHYIKNGVTKKYRYCPFCGLPMEKK